MGSGDIIAGSNPPTRRPKKPTTVIVRNPARGAGASSRRSEITSTSAEDHCGAMSQQRADSGTTMAPQKFLHLVGCREPNARGPGGR